MKMENKVLIKLIVPESMKTYDIFIPVNEFIWKVTNLIVKAVSDLSNSLNKNTDYLLIDSTTGQPYENNKLVIESNIRYGTSIILCPCPKSIIPINIQK